jgi:hypothetical protein
MSEKGVTAVTTVTLSIKVGVFWGCGRELVTGGGVTRETRDEGRKTLFTGER